MSRYFYWQEQDLYLLVRVQPRSAQDQINGVLNNRLKIKLTAPPVDGKANTQLVKYLARQFRIPASRVAVISGHTGQNKKLMISHPKTIPEWLK